jgi:hypothetical protein
MTTYNKKVKAGKAEKLPLKSREKLGSAGLHSGHNHRVHQLQLPEHLRTYRKLGQSHEIKLKYSEKFTVKRGNIEQVINFKVILKILRDVL